MKNDLLLRVARGEKTERPPVWLMRQAGRILPQYREIRNRLSGFKELVETPELACEVTIQPVDELDVDAAIIFSDILVIPEAMGLSYEMIEARGPFFPEVIKSASDVNKLSSPESAAENLHYVYDAVALTKKELNGRVPLLGFAGAPFTIFAYMVEGKGSKTFSVAKKMLYRDPELAHRLLEAITLTTIVYLKNKVKAGVDLVQIFDSWAGVLSSEDFRTFSLPYIQKIVFALKPLIGESCIIQGNLDPCVLYADKNLIKKHTIDMLNAFGPHHIANLGHGVYPDTPLDAVKCFVDTVKEFKY